MSKSEAFGVPVCAAALAVAILSFAPGGASAAAPVEPKCKVFATAKERAQCSCAVQHGAWVSEVQGRWRVIYPRRHQERHCASVAAN